MNCFESLNLLQRYLDGDSSEPMPECAAHEAGCPGCRGRWEAARSMRPALQSAPRPQPSADLVHRILARALREKKQTLARHVQFRVRLALAASVLLACFLGYQSLPQVASRPGTIALVKAPAPKMVESPVRALAGLSAKFVDQSRQNFQVVLAVAGPVDASAIEKWTPPESSVHPISFASLEMSENLRSVTSSARKAFQFFSQEFPMIDLTEGEGRGQ